MVNFTFDGVVFDETDFLGRGHVQNRKTIGGTEYPIFMGMHVAALRDMDSKRTDAVGSETNAATSASDAAASASAAATSETNAAASAASVAGEVLKAAEWANNPEDSLVSVGAGGDGVDDYSALHHARKAEASATAAAASATYADQATGFLAVNDFASQAEAEAGTDNTKVMTPLRSAQAIEALTTKSNRVQLTTKGAATAGDVAGLLADGSVASIPQSSAVTTGTVVDGTSGTFTFSTAGYISHCRLQGNKFFVVFRGDVSGTGNDSLVGVVFTVSGTTVAAGTPVYIANSGGTQARETSCAAHSATSVVITHRSPTNSDHIECVACSITGTTITPGSLTTISAANNNPSYPNSTVALDATTGVVFWTQATTNDLVGEVYSLSGTTITPSGIENTIYSGTTITYNVATLLDTDKIIVGMSDTGSVVTRVVTRSGNTLTPSASYPFASGGPGNALAIEKLSATKFIMAANGVAANAYVGVGTVSGTTVTMGTETSSSSIATVFNDNNQITFGVINEDTAVIFKKDIVVNDNNPIVWLCHINGAELKFSDKITLNTEDVRAELSYGIIGDVCDPSAGDYRAFVAFIDNTSFAVKGFASQLPFSAADGYIGFFDGTYTDGQTATIVLSGGLQGNQSGLTPGAQYFVQDDGSISTTPTMQPCGEGLSVTQLMVNRRKPGDTIMLDMGEFSGVSALEIDNKFLGNLLEYQIKLKNITVSVNGARLHMRFSTDGGLTYVQDLNYQYINRRLEVPSASTAYATSSAQNYIDLSTSSGIGTGGGNENANIDIKILNPNDASLSTKIIFESIEMNNSDNLNDVRGSGELEQYNVVNGVRFYPSSGTFSGSYELSAVVS